MLVTATLKSFEFTDWIDFTLVLEHLNLYNGRLYFEFPKYGVVYGSNSVHRTYNGNEHLKGDLMLTPLTESGKFTFMNLDRFTADYILLPSNRLFYNHFRCDYKDDLDLWNLRRYEFCHKYHKAQIDRAYIMFYNEHAIFKSNDCTNVMIIAVNEESLHIVNSNNMFVKHFGKVYDNIIKEGTFVGRS